MNESSRWILQTIHMQFRILLVKRLSQYLHSLFGHGSQTRSWMLSAGGYKMTQQYIETLRIIILEASNFVRCIKGLAQVYGHLILVRWQSLWTLVDLGDKSYSFYKLYTSRSKNIFIILFPFVAVIDSHNNIFPPLTWLLSSVHRFSANKIINQKENNNR